MKYCILHEKDRQWVKRIVIESRAGVSHIGVDLTASKMEAIHLTHKQYSPNETRLVELLESLTDSTYKVEVV